MSKPNAERLSLHLLAEAQRFEGYPTTVYRTKRNLDLKRRVWDKIGDELIAHHHTFMTGPFSEASLDPEKLAALFDERYCRSLLQNVPDIVTRTLRLRRLPLSGLPKGDIVTFIREASRTSALGFFVASIALCRSALEAVVRPCAAKYIGAAATAGLDLREIIDRAQIPDRRVKDLAHKVRILGNKVIHEGKPVTSNDTLEAIEAVRTVVAYLESR